MLYPLSYEGGIAGKAVGDLSAPFRLVRRAILPTPARGSSLA